VTTYELLTFLHIASAIIWLGAGFVFTLLILGAEMAGDEEREARHHSDVPWLAPRLFIPASFATLIFGILLVIDGPWSFDYLWVTLGLLGWLASFGVGITYFRTEGEKIAALAAERGPDDPEIRARIRRLNIVDRLEILILFLVVADMVIKPTGDDSGVLVAGALLIAGAAAWALAAIGRGAQARAAA
jgi:uncharacterized membrane protein